MRRTFRKLAYIGWGFGVFLWEQGDREVLCEWHEEQLKQDNVFRCRVTHLRERHAKNWTRVDGGGSSCAVRTLPTLSEVFWMCASYIRSFALFSRAAMRGCENTTKRPDRDMRNWVKRGKKQNVIYVPHSRTCRTGPHNLSPPVQWAAEHVEWVLLPLYWSGIPIARKHHQNSAVLKPKITVSIRGEWGKRTDRGGSGVEYSSLETN